MEINIKITDFQHARRVECALDLFYQTECFWVKDWNEQMRKDNNFYSRTADILNTRNYLRDEIIKAHPDTKFAPDKEFIDY